MPMQKLSIRLDRQIIHLNSKKGILYELIRHKTTIRHKTNLIWVMFKWLFELEIFTFARSVLLSITTFAVNLMQLTGNKVEGKGPVQVVIIFLALENFWSYCHIVCWQVSDHISLAVRDLSNLVKPEDIITTEHMVTLLSVVSKFSQKDWLSSYETLTDYVVWTAIFLTL